jgi:predicted nucleic acid-binding Zn ribbon protein
MKKVFLPKCNNRTECIQREKGMGGKRKKKRQKKNKFQCYLIFILLLKRDLRMISKTFSSTFLEYLMKDKDYYFVRRKKKFQ